MPLAAGIDVSLRALTSDFTGPLKGAEKSVDQLGSKIKQTNATMASGSGMGSFGAALGTGAAVAAAAIAGVAASLALLARSQFEPIDQLAKMADKLGATTEAMAGLQHAGDLAGLSSEDLGKALQTMQKTVAEAAGGSAEAQQKLGALGLTAEQLLALPLEQRFGAIGDALNKMGDQSEKINSAMDIMGKGGANALNLLKDGSKGLGEAIAEAQKLGLGVSREDAAKVEAFNDAWTRLQASITGIGRTLAVAFAPALETVTNVFTNIVVQVRGAIKEIMPIGEAWFDAFKAGFELVRGAWDAVWGAIGSGLSELGAALGINLGTWGGWKDSLILYFRAVEFGYKNWKEVGMLAVEQLALGFVTFGNDIVHLFTSVIPQALSSAWELIKGVFSGESLSGIWARELEKMRQSTMRARTGIEEALQSSINERSARLGQDFAAFLEAKNKKGPPALKGDKVNDALARTEQKLKAGLADFGSKEAADIILKARMATQGGGGQSEKDILKAMYEQGREEMRSLAKIEENTRKAGTLAPADL